jgi:SgrR family transcriptional regulator
MKLAEHYLHLHSKLETSKEYPSFLITIQEIADILCYTKRHAKNIVKSLDEHKWVSWDIVSGRGKRSRLTFLLSRDEVTKEVAKELVRQGKYHQALEQLSSVSPIIKERFHYWLQGQLGFRVELKDEKEIDVLRYPFYKAIISLDPARAQSRHEGHLVEHLFDTLLKYNGETGGVDPHLAHYWEECDGGRIWTFYLRKGVKFHHGREMTAHDVLETIQRLKSLEAPHLNAWMFNDIKEIKVVRSTTVQFILTKPNFLFPHYLCHSQTSIIPIEKWQEDEDQFSVQPVGTGPFKVVTHNDTMIVLEVYENYFKERAYLDRIEILSLPELSPKNKELINHWSSSESEKEKQEWHKVKQLEQGASYVSFNLMKEGVQQKVGFRKAISLAFDLDLMIVELGQDYIPAYSFLSEQSATKGKKDFNSVLSKQLLKEVGYNGETINIYASELRKGADHSPEARWIQQQCEKIGVSTLIEVVPFSKLTQPETLKKADIIVSGVLLNQNLVLSLMRMFQTSIAFIYNMVGSQLAMEIERKLELVKQEKDRQEQLKILMELEEILRQNYTIIFLHHRYHSVNVNHNSSLEGVSLSELGRINYKDVWFKH